MVYFVHTMGELCIVPIGSSTVSKLAPAKFLSSLMAIWMLSVFFSGVLGGLFAANYDSITHWKFFLIPAAIAFGLSLVLIMLIKPIKRWMHKVK